MLKRLLILGLCLSAQIAQSQEEEDGPSIADVVGLEDAFARELLDLEDISAGFSQGLDDGRGSFQHRFESSCTDMVLNQTGIEEYQAYVNSLERDLASHSYFYESYHAGMMVGFNNAYLEHFASCEDELSDNTRQALDEKIALCRATVRGIEDDVTIMRDFALAAKAGRFKLSSEELLSLVLLGEESEAWKRIKESDQDFVRSMPCQAVLIEALTAGVKKASAKN